MVKRVVSRYDDNELTHSMRKNLRTINACLTRHWPDLALTDNEFVQLQLRLIDDTNPRFEVHQTPTQLHTEKLGITVG